MSIKRQLRQWSYEITQLWGRMTFGGRIALGAMISIGLAIAVTRTVTAPLSKQVAALTKNLTIPENLDPEKSDEIIMNREKEAKLKESLVTWKERLNRLMGEQTSLDEALHTRVIAEIQKVFGRLGVQIVSEVSIPDVPPPAPAPAAKGRKNEAEVKVKSSSSENPIGIFVHDYRVRGSFRQIQASLLFIERLPFAIHLSDFHLSAESSAQPRVLTLSFKLHIRYVKKTAYGS